MLHTTHTHVLFADSADDAREQFLALGVKPDEDPNAKLDICKCTEDPDFDFGKPPVPNASHLLMSEKDGIIESQTNHNEPNPDIYQVQFDYQPGDEVHKFHVGPHRIGHIITKGKTLEEAQTLLFDAMDKVEIKVK